MSEFYPLVMLPDAILTGIRRAASVGCFVGDSNWEVTKTLGDLL